MLFYDYGCVLIFYDAIVKGVPAQSSLFAKCSRIGIPMFVSGLVPVRLSF